MNTPEKGKFPDTGEDASRIGDTALFPDGKRLVRILILMRGFRGIAQGAMLANLALSLRMIGWSGTEIGLLLSLGTLGEMGTGLATGFLAGKHLRARRLLLLGESLTFFGAMTGLASSLFFSSHAGLWAAALLGGFGQRSNGSPGPFAPAEQSLLSRTLPPSEWSPTGSVLFSSGFLGMGLGSLLALVPESSLFPLSQKSGPLSWIYGANAALSLLGLILLVRLMTLSLPPDPSRTHSSSREQEVRKGERSRIALLVLVNLVGGLSIGLADLMLPYWFSLRFHIGIGHIAPLMAGVFFLTGLAALFGGRLIRLFGELSLFFKTQAASLLLLGIFPWIPDVRLDFALLTLRFILNRAPVGIRQAFVNRLVRGHRVGLAVSANIVSLQGGALLGPLLAGFMFDRSLSWTPFVLAALLQGGALLLSKRLFLRPPSREGA